MDGLRAVVVPCDSLAEIWGSENQDTSAGSQLLKDVIRRDIFINDVDSRDLHTASNFLMH